MKQNLTELEGDLDSSTIVIGDFIKPLSTIDRMIRKKIGTKRAI